jgi:hypothetical protein
MNIIRQVKATFAVSVGLAASLASRIPLLALESNDNGEAIAQGIAEKSREAYSQLLSYSDSGIVVSEMGGQSNTLTFNTRLQRPNLYLIEWSGVPASKGAVWSDGSGDYFVGKHVGEPENPDPQKMGDMRNAFSRAAGLSWAAASTISGAFFNQDLGDVFIAPVLSGRHPLNLERDGHVGDVDCYVVSSVLDFSKIPDNKGKPGTASTTLWIGKTDFLIHQSRTKYVEKVDSSTPTDQAIDDAIKKSLQMQHKPVTPEAIAAMRPQMTIIMKQVQATLKSGFEAGVVTTQIHTNISLNRRFSPSDFAH